LADLEEQFLRRCTTVDPNTDLWEKPLADEFRRLESVKQRVDQAAGRLERCPSLRQAWQAPVQKHLEVLRTSYTRLMEAFPEGISDANQADASLAKHYRDLKAGLEDGTRRLNDQGFKDHLGDVDANFWADSLYGLRFGMYQTAMDRFGKLRQTRIAGLESLRDTLQTGRQLVRQDQDNIAAVLKLHTERYRTKQGHQAALGLLQAADRRFCREVLLWWLGNMPADASALERYIDRASSDQYNLTQTAVVFSAWDSLNREGQVRSMPRDLRDRFQQASQEYAQYARAYIDYCLSVRGQALLADNLPKAEDWRTYHLRLGTLSRAPTDVFKMLESCNKQLKGYLTPVESCPHGSATAAKFDEKWAPLYNRFDQQKAESVLARWYALSDDPHQARTALLRCRPDEFLQTYFVSASAPSLAAPDYYFYRLAMTALELLATEVDRDSRRELEAIKTCVGKFPMDRSAKENLAASEVERMQRFSERFLTAVYPAGAIGEGATAGNGEMDELLARLRGAAQPPAWMSKTDALPPARSQYWCQVYQITTTPTALVRRAVLTKGSGSVLWDDMGRNTKPVGTLGYDCSDEGIQLALYTLPTGGELVGEPKLFPGPWAWHRMLEKHEFETGSSTYIVRQAVTVKGENVTMEIRLRFFRKQDGSGSPIEVFVPVP
jgi:hypothetical protein